MTLQQLYYAITISETGSMNKAAEKLYIAQPSLSISMQELEKELGITLSNSPTVNVGYEVVSELPKERHESPMLSLDKTKEVEELKNFVGDQKVLMSWKMDGLTVVLTYRDGKLIRRSPEVTEKSEK